MLSIRGVAMLLFGVCLLSGLDTMVARAEGIWTRKTDMPTPRMYLSTSVVDGRIYAIGGSSYATISTASTLKTVEEYDPATDTWAARSSMSTARWGLSTCTVNGKIYAIGGAQVGVSPLRTVEEYDAATDTWTVKSPMPTARWGLATSVVDGKIYAVGGMISAGFGCRIVEEYDPATNTWTTKAPMNLDRYAPSACAVNGKVYVLGGVTSYPNVTATVEEYDPERNTWTMKGSLLAAKTYFSASEVNGRIYAIGGAPHPDNATAIVYEYDPVTGTSTAKPNLLNPRTVLSASAVGGRVYAIGGSTSGWPWPPSGLVEEYTMIPTVDFNGDGIVDAADVVIMIEHWLTDYPLCDIGPMPWGDGIVDVQDLIVLAEHLFEEILPFGCVAYWKLDQTEGNIARNSTGFNDGICHGEPIWQSIDGKIGGALQFDGVDDYVEIDFVLSPADGAFSTCAWIKGGAPDQVIISQTDGIGTGQTWLGTDPSEGKLLTGLAPLAGRSPAQPLVSEFDITDGQWHHIGIVVAAYQSIRFRYLYLDGVRVVMDTQSVELPYANGGLYIGVDKNLDAMSFFSGLIDDVRIYNVALSADEIAALAQ